jgi:hypothetical protein
VNQQIITSSGAMVSIKTITLCLHFYIRSFLLFISHFLIFVGFNGRVQSRESADDTSSGAMASIRRCKERRTEGKRHHAATTGKAV